MLTTTRPIKPKATKDNLGLYQSAFERLEKSAAQNEPAWVNAIRQAGISHFTELGFPTIHHEEWKYTNIAPIVQLPFKPAMKFSADGLARESLERFAFAGLQGSRLVFVNGHYAAALSTVASRSDGVKIGSLAQALGADAELVKSHLGRYARVDDSAFRSLNAAFFADGAFVYVPKGIVVEEPIHLLFVASSKESGASVHARNLIVAQPNSQLKVIESYVSLNDAPYVTNAVTEIFVGEGAIVEHCKFQNESVNAFHLATIQSQLQRASHFTSHSISNGARIARNDINTVMVDEGVECVLNGLYLASGTQLVDHHMVVDHAKPRCASHEFFHGILGGKSRGVFNGKIFVRPDAQKTDAKQTNRNLLLTDEATVNAKPQLEIFADDVKCTHGATVGQLDDEAIFYLRTRGIGLADARRMLIHAFASDILNRISIEPVRQQLDAFLHDRLEAEAQAAEA